MFLFAHGVTETSARRPKAVSSPQLDTRMVSQGEVQDGGTHLAKGNYFLNIIGFGEEKEKSRLLDAGGES